MDDQHYRKLERAYRSARCNEFYRPEVSISEGAATVAVQVDPRMHHAAGALHGSIYFKVLDDAAFFAANSMVPDVFVLTASFNIHLYRPVVSGTLEGRGRLTHRSGRLFFAEATAVDDKGKIVAQGSGTFMRSKIVLNEDIGYC